VLNTDPSGQCAEVGQGDDYCHTDNGSGNDELSWCGHEGQPLCPTPGTGTTADPIPPSSTPIPPAPLGTIPPSSPPTTTPTPPPGKNLAQKILDKTGGVGGAAALVLRRPVPVPWPVIVAGGVCLGVLYLAALGPTIKVPPLSRPQPAPTPDDWDVITVYRGLNGTSPSAFRVDRDGVSVFETPPTGYKFVVGFLLRYKKPKLPNTVGVLLASVLKAGTATYTPQWGEGHWSLNFPGKTEDEIKKLLSEFAKAYKTAN
jgi:hypothetical protein